MFGDTQNKLAQLFLINLIAIYFLINNKISMEKRMEECAREIMKENTAVRGIVCTDTNGALLSGKGSLDNPHSSAVVSQLANLAAALEPNSQPLGIVLSSPSSAQAISNVPPSSLQSNPQMAPHEQNDASKVLIRTNGVITLAIHK